MRAASILICLLLVIGCSGKKSSTQTKRAPSPEQLEMAEAASNLAAKSDSLLQQAPETLTESLTDLNEKAQRFSNASQRYGPRSLEARNAFDRLRYQAVQLDSQITSQAFPDFAPNWKDLRKDLDAIGSRLGYRIESPVQ